VPLKNCHNINHFRALAKSKLPSPIFHYLDGGSDDKITLKKNSQSFNSYDLIPNVLTGIDSVDTSTTILDKKIKLPLFLSPVAMQQLYQVPSLGTKACSGERSYLYGLAGAGQKGVEKSLKNLQSEIERNMILMG